MKLYKIKKSKIDNKRGLYATKDIKEGTKIINYIGKIITNRDPLAQFELKSEDFYEITKRTLRATNEFTNGKVVSVLEGGYDLNALADSAFNHVNALVENN